MLMRMPFDSSSPIQFSPVNWLPWSVLKMPGLRPVDPHDFHEPPDPFPSDVPTMRDEFEPELARS
jgi:hypothetical protein